MSDLIRRSDLLDTYARPYRRWVPVVLRQYRVHVLAALLVALTIVAAIVELATGESDDWVAATVAAAILFALYAAWATLNAVILVRGRTEEWRGGNELGRVRLRRPHGSDAHTMVAHEEYAVAVADDGNIVTFVYVPLAAHEQAAPDADLIPGVPRYEAFEHAAVPFDPESAARAAEQLAEAQAHAAQLEAAAIDRALEELERDRSARELRAESRSTGAALRGITGQ